jgi:hypothetical protein
MKLLLSFFWFVSSQVILVANISLPSYADDQGWLTLTDPSQALALPLVMAWQDNFTDWIIAGNVEINPDDSHALRYHPVQGKLGRGKLGSGVMISSLKGHDEFRNLTSRQLFSDLDVHVEFLIPKGSNAGIKLQGLYEIQIRDSYGKKNLTASDCGGIYPRAELYPVYHTTDKGVPARINASKPAGKWQTLDIRFQAPRFDEEGNKIVNARFLKVTFNGQVIHDDVELKWPTGHAWRTKPEVPLGPLFLQGDHGPVAFRNVRVRIP